MATFVDSEEYDWVILYLIGCEDPFTKVPIVANTVLAAQAVVGLSQEARFVNCNGTVANGVVAQYKTFMFCGPEFFQHVDNIVDIINAFYRQVRTKPDFYMDRETAYGFCMSVFPPTTKPEVGIRALLRRHEVKSITKSSALLSDIQPIRFEPHAVMDRNVVR